MTDYERIGGETALRGIVEEFLRRASQDSIIGFFFAGTDLTRIARREVELAAERLGGPVTYGGRPLHVVHGSLGINKGHLRRRLAILRSVLEEANVEEAIIETWLSHERSLEDQITNQKDCIEPPG